MKPTRKNFTLEATSLDRLPELRPDVWLFREWGEAEARWLEPPEELWDDEEAVEPPAAEAEAEGRD
jgi:hypothetical protein